VKSRPHRSSIGIAPRSGFRPAKPGRLNRKPTPEEEYRAFETYETRLIPAMQSGQYERALKHAYKVLKLVPRDVDTWIILIDAVELGRAGADVQLEVAKQAIRAVPRLEEAHELRIRAAKALGDPAEESEAIRRFLDSTGWIGPRERRRLEERLAVVQRKAAAESARTRTRRAAGEHGRGNAPHVPPAARVRSAGGAPRPVTSPRRLEVPVLAPEGAPLRIEVDSLRDSLDTLLGDDDGLPAVHLALAAADAQTVDQYDRLLSLDDVHGVERFPHQVETVLRVLKRFRGRVLLADEVGLGKTIEAAFVLKEYLLRRQVRRVLILCPPALVGQWRAELEEKFSITAKTTSQSEFRKDPEAFFASDGVLVASLAVVRSSKHRDIVRSSRFDLVVVDEAHHLKNRATRGWELVDSLRSRFLLMLTATPVETDLTELYNLVTLLRPGTLGTEAEFRRRFQDPGDPLAPREPEQLRELLRDVMIRNTRAQSGVDLPPRTARTIVVEPAPEEKALYDDLVALARAVGRERRTLCRLLLEEAGSSAEAVARTAWSAAPPSEEFGGALRSAASRARSVRESAKVERLIDLLPGGKTLVFSRFLATGDAIASELSRRGLPHVSFTGSMPAAQRASAIETFRRDVDVMLCSEVGGEGQNLQFCHRLINFDLPWNPMLLEQRVGRIHRIGQKEPVEIVNLCAAGTAEERILGVLDRRVNLFELVVGEMDLLLGDLEDEREFGDRVYDIIATSSTDADMDRGFVELGDLLARARERLNRVKAVDEAIFRDELEA
jgi:superfamily II DNA or RNA helicase